MNRSRGPRTAGLDPGRLGVILVLILVVVVVLVTRLLSLQVFGSQEWIDLAVENYTRNVSSPAPRGIIYDRNGYILARNVASYNLTITPAGLPDDEADIQRIYRAVSRLTGVPVNSGTVDEAKLFAACVEGPGIAQLVELGDSLAPYSPVAIKCNVREDVARTVEERGVDWPGVDIEVNPIRDYPTGSLTANLIGYLGPIPAVLEEEYRQRGFVPNRDKVGYAGIELSLQEVLTGQNGRRVVQVDVARFCFLPAARCQLPPVLQPSASRRLPAASCLYDGDRPPGGRGTHSPGGLQDQRGWLSQCFSIQQRNAASLAAVPLRRIRKPLFFRARSCYSASEGSAF